LKPIAVAYGIDKVPLLPSVDGARAGVDGQPRGCRRGATVLGMAVRSNGPLSHDGAGLLRSAGGDSFGCLELARIPLGFVVFSCLTAFTWGASFVLFSAAIGDAFGTTTPRRTTASTTRRRGSRPSSRLGRGQARGSDGKLGPRSSGSASRATSSAALIVLFVLPARDLPVHGASTRDEVIRRLRRRIWRRQPRRMARLDPRITPIGRFHGDRRLLGRARSCACAVRIAPICWRAGSGEIGQSA